MLDMDSHEYALREAGQLNTNQYFDWLRRRYSVQIEARVAHLWGTRTDLALEQCAQQVLHEAGHDIREGEAGLMMARRIDDAEERHERLAQNALAYGFR